MNKLLAVVAPLLLIFPSIFSMDIAPVSESKEDKELRKNLYHWYDKKNNREIVEYIIFRERDISRFKHYTYKGTPIGPLLTLKNGAIDYINNSLFPKKPAVFLLDNDTIENAKAALEVHSKKMERKIDNDKSRVTEMTRLLEELGVSKNSPREHFLRGCNYLSYLLGKQKKYKNLLYGGAIAGGLSAAAHLYLKNKNKLSGIIKINNPAVSYCINTVSSCADAVARYYSQTWYRTIVYSAIDKITRIDSEGSSILHKIFNKGAELSPRLRDRTIFESEHIVSRALQVLFEFLTDGAKSLWPLFNRFFLHGPEWFAVNQFNKVLNYESDLLRKKEKDKKIMQFLQKKTSPIIL